jgi:hypothetical protein
MLSTKRAAEVLIKNGLADNFEWELDYYDVQRTLKFNRPILQSKYFALSCEIYGKKAELYFYCMDVSIANLLASILQEAGGCPDFKWCPEQGNFFSMKVSYFKGWHWWE